MFISKNEWQAVVSAVRIARLLFAMMLLGLCLCTRDPYHSSPSDSFDILRTDFISPPDQFRFISHWIWNGPVTENEIHFQIREFFDKGIRTLIVHGEDATAQQWSAAKNTADSLGILIYAEFDSIGQFDPETLGIANWSAESCSRSSGFTALKLAAGRARQAGDRRVLMDLDRIRTDVSFQDLKYIFNQAAAHGANRFIVHSRFRLLGDSISNSLSFSYHMPWWDIFMPVSDYSARLMMTLSFGEPVRPALVILPDHRGGGHDLLASADHLQKELDSAIEYDLIQPAQLSGARVRKHEISLGTAKYQRLVLLPGTMPLTESHSLIEQFAKSAGPENILDLAAFVPPPDSVSIHGQTGPDLESRLADTLAAYNREWIQKFQITCSNRMGLTHQRRQLHDGQLIYLFNSTDKVIGGKLRCEGEAVYNLNCWNGRISRVQFSKIETGIQVPFEVKPGENLLFFAADRDSFEITSREESSPVRETIIQPEVEPRVMPDYYNSWNLIRVEDSDPFKPVKPDRFSFQWPRQMDPSTLMIVADCRRQELMVNSMHIPSIPDAWLLDRAFSVYSIGEAVGTGNNLVQIPGCERSYGLIGLFGDFLLVRSGQEFKIRPMHTLSFDAWEAEMPFYSDAVSYIQTYNIHRESGKYVIRLGNWSGTAAEVLVNETPAGLIVREEEIDVTGLLRDGWNDISVSVYGSMDHFFSEINRIRGLRPPRAFGLEEPFQCVKLAYDRRGPDS